MVISAGGETPPPLKLRSDIHMEHTASNAKVISVRGAVVDVGFDGGALPAINTALVVQWDRPEPLLLEVHSHVDPVTVRGIALQATAGLARGAQVRATGAPISVPVGDAVLGRLLDVVGAVRDRGPALPARHAAAGHPQSAADASRKRPRRRPCSRPASR